MTQGTPAGFAVAVGGLLLLAGAGLVLLGVLARRGRLPRNRWSGYRTPLTMRSDGHWRAAHAAGADQLIAAGVPPLIAGAVVLTRPPLGWSGAFALAGAAGMGVFALLGARRAVQAARRYEDEQRR